ncbi:hypothetical protein JOE32_000462 [Pseudomonas sp. PvP025]|nr:hypothetical protein [Pseudomonas sp. PvP025]MDQ0397855.1 hypothetical protein [Pseudomonas sp. PvP006]
MQQRGRSLELKAYNGSRNRLPLIRYWPVSY